MPGASSSLREGFHTRWQGGPQSAPEKIQHRPTSLYCGQWMVGGLWSPWLVLQGPHPAHVRGNCRESFQPPPIVSPEGPVRVD
eukprot:scaffold137_cov398-Prasinococcus_capsulatus_cf.AAC.17